MKLSRVLFQYRLTSHSTTGVSPAKLLLGRQPCSHLNQFRPGLQQHVEREIERQKRNHDKRTCERRINIGDSVLVRNFTNGSFWMTGVITSRQGPRMFVVRLDSGQEVRRHIDQIRRRVVRPDDTPASVQTDYGLDSPLPFSVSSETEPSPRQQSSDTLPTAPRHSNRERHPPDRFGH